MKIFVRAALPVVCLHKYFHNCSYFIKCLADPWLASLSNTIGESPPLSFLLYLITPPCHFSPISCTQDQTVHVNAGIWCAGNNGYVLLPPPLFFLASPQFGACKHGVPPSPFPSTLGSQHGYKSPGLHRCASKYDIGVGF